MVSFVARVQLGLLLAASSRFWPDKVIVAPWRHLINGAGIRPTTTTAVACCMWHRHWHRQSRGESSDMIRVREHVAGIMSE